MGTDLSKSDNEFSASPHHPLESSLSRSNVYRMHNTHTERESNNLLEPRHYTSVNKKRNVAILNSAELMHQTQHYNSKSNSNSNNITNTNDIYLSLPILSHQKSSFERSREISPIANSAPGISCKPKVNHLGTLNNNSLPSLSNTSITNNKESNDGSSSCCSVKKENNCYDNVYRRNITPSELISAEKSTSYIHKENQRPGNSNNIKGSKNQYIDVNEYSKSSAGSREDWLAATESELVLEWNNKRREKEEEIEKEALHSWSENYCQYSTRQKNNRRKENTHGLSQNVFPTYDNNINSNTNTSRVHKENTICNNCKNKEIGDCKTQLENQNECHGSCWKHTKQLHSFSRFKYTSSSNTSSTSSSSTGTKSTTSSSTSSLEEEEQKEKMQMIAAQSTNKETAIDLLEIDNKVNETSAPRVPVECDAVPFPFNRSTGVIYKIDSTHDVNTSSNNNNNNHNSSHLANMSNATEPLVPLNEIPVGEQFYEALRNAWRQPSERGAHSDSRKNFSSQFVREIVAEITDKDRTKEFTQYVPLQPIIGVLCRNWEEEGLYDQVFEEEKPIFAFL